MLLSSFVSPASLREFSPFSEYPRTVAFAFDILTLALPATLRLGGVRLPLFGVIATAGILVALALGDRTAKLAGVEPVKLWDAGVFAVVSAFLCSRLLLAAWNPGIFVRHPLLVLVQPSVSIGGLLLTVVCTGLWLRDRKVPMRRALDAWAMPCAVLAAILQVGHFLEGTDAGTPTSLPWGVAAVSYKAVRVHPVQLYAAAAFGLLAVWLYRELVRASAAEFAKPGGVSAPGLVGGGVLSFLLSFFRQPYDSFGEAWLDPAQYAALIAVIAGAGIWDDFVAQAIAAPGFCATACRGRTFDRCPVRTCCPRASAARP